MSLKGVRVDERVKRVEDRVAREGVGLTETERDCVDLVSWSDIWMESESFV